MKKWQKILLPLTDKKIKNLKVGDLLLLSGIIYTARDAAHQKLMKVLDKKPPFLLKNQIIYYTGPTETPPGKIIGSIGPTTSTRMDNYTIKLLQQGLKATIGKGPRSKNIISALKKYKALYFITIGGAGVFLSHCVKKAKIVCFPELQTEAIRELEVKDFPVIVAIDTLGNNLFFI